MNIIVVICFIALIAVAIYNWMPKDPDEDWHSECVKAREDESAKEDLS